MHNNHDDVNPIQVRRKHPPIIDSFGVISGVTEGPKTHPFDSAQAVSLTEVAKVCELGVAEASLSYSSGELSVIPGRFVLANDDRPDEPLRSLSHASFTDLQRTEM